MFAVILENKIAGLDDGYHGTDGPMSISENPDTHSVSHAFVEACKEFGLENRDYNGSYMRKILASGNYFSRCKPPF